jgi:hypothetical protein
MDSDLPYNGNPRQPPRLSLEAMSGRFTGLVLDTFDTDRKLRNAQRELIMNHIETAVLARQQALVESWREFRDREQAEWIRQLQQAW